MTDRGGISKAIEKSIVTSILAAIPVAEAIYLHGSRVRGGVHPESDLDVAVLLPRGLTIPQDVLLQLRGDLEAESGWPVDVSILDLGADVVYCKEVVANGRRIHPADCRAVARFEMEALSRYARLCEDRAPVVLSYVAEERRG